jgi:hypothetical protein
MLTYLFDAGLSNLPALHAAAYSGFEYQEMPYVLLQASKRNVLLNISSLRGCPKIINNLC